MSELVVYICPNIWKPEGIFVKKASTELNIVEKEDKTEITTYICPSGYNCKGYEIDLLLAKPIAGYILCLLKEENKQHTDIQELFLSLHNQLRTSHPEECPDPELLELDEEASAMAEWLAKDMLEKNYFSHTDSLGRNPSVRADDFYVKRIGLGENIAVIESTDPISDEELVHKFMEDWMNSPPHRHNIMTPEFNRIGVGFAKGEGKGIIRSDLDVIKNFAVVDFLIKENSLEEIKGNLPQFDCQQPKVDRIRWHQTYSIEEYTGEDGTRKTRKIPGDQILFKMKLPTLCVLEKALFVFEETPCKWELDPVPLLKEIPEDGVLRIVWTDENAGGSSYIDKDGNLTVVFNLTKACFLPGEWMALYVWIRGEVECNPIVWASGWFETKCFTSGIIQGCGLIEGDNVIEGGYLVDFNTSWIGDERLHWLVWYKGTLIWLKSSDWKKYRIGERCFIWKNGIGFFNNDEGLNTKLPPGCRWPVLSLEPIEDTIVSDSNVSYRLNRNSDIIVPYSFMGI